METSIVDIMPTVLSLVGIRVPAGVEGVDLSGIAYRGEDAWDRLTLSELYRLNSLNVQAAIRQRGAKLIHHFNRRLAEAFDLEHDPQEQRPGALEAGVREHLFGRLHQELDRLWPLYFSRVDQQGIAAIEVDSDTKSRLEALGYME
jgi:arylsulfatase A-like enzyme